MSESFKEDAGDEEHTKYFDLMRVVGTSGKYQLYCLIIMSIIGLINGCISLGSTFIVYVTPYSNCPSQYSFDADTCNQYVCSLPQDQRAQYLSPNALKTLGNQFQDYNCKDNFILEIFQMCSAIGGIFGYIFVPLITDNLGRKYSMILAALFSIIGIFMMIFSNGIMMASLGYFTSGFGLNAAFNINFAFINDTVENDLRQVYSVLVQVSYAFGGLVNPLFFFILKDWKLVFYFVYLPPCFIYLALLIVMMRETPQFLIRRYSNEEILNEMREIAEMNETVEQYQTSHLMNAHHFQNLKQEFDAEMHHSDKQIFHTWDLFRYDSLRFITFALSALNLMINFAYFGPQMMIDSFGFTIYVGGTALAISDILSFVLLSFFIKQFQRKFLALTLFIISFVLSFILIFIHRNGKCIDDCTNNYFEIILIFGFRFCINIQNAAFAVYLNELYPKIIVNIGYGFCSVFGSVSQSLAPIVIGQLRKVDFPIMTLFSLSCVFGFLFSWVLPETYGKAPREKIKEHFVFRNLNKFEEISVYQQ